MIVKIHDKLARLVRGAPKREDVPDGVPKREGIPMAEPDPIPHLSIWDGKKLLKKPATRPAGPPLIPGCAPPHILPLVPDWMKDMIMEGTMLFMDPQDFAGLDFRLHEYIDIIKQ